MGNSTITLQRAFDTVTARPGVMDPRKQPGGFGDNLALDIANQVMADLIVDRFNWKFNSKVATPFYTNGLQQDYPQLAAAGGPIGWGESCTALEINSTMTPKPVRKMLWRRQLEPTSLSRATSGNLEICWMYNRDLILGEWPGRAVWYYPLISPVPQPQNPNMSMVDDNDNLLIVTTAGLTGDIPPELPANSAEGTEIEDGSVTWTVVSPDSQGYRLSCLPGAGSPNLQVRPIYQLDPPRFADYAQKLDPLPDSFSQYFYRGLEAQIQGSAAAVANWIHSLSSSKAQGDREQNSVSLLPATSPVEPLWGYGGRRSATDPY